MGNTLLRDLSIYWGMVHVIFMFLMLFKSRFTRKKTIWIAGLGMGALMLLNGIGLVVYGLDALSKAFLFTCSITSLIFCYVMSADTLYAQWDTCEHDKPAQWSYDVTTKERPFGEPAPAAAKP